MPLLSAARASKKAALLLRKTENRAKICHLSRDIAAAVSMQLTFRPVRPEEIPEASALVDAAYAPQVRKIYGDTPRGRWQHYDESKIESYRSREPEGLRAGLWRDKLVTLCVCRSYGSLGWFHTLAVHPRFQSRGLGHQTVTDAETYLQQRGVTSIGLMTWPTAINNLGFYLKQAYRLRGMTVYAYRDGSRPIITGASPFYATQFGHPASQSESRQQNAIRTLCNSIALGLDYLPWVLWAQDQSHAKTLLLWRNGSLAALALTYFWPDTRWAEGKLLLMRPGLTHEERLWVLEHLRLWVTTNQRDTFGFPVDLTADLASSLLQQGFRLFAESMVNLVKGDDLPDANYHLVRFGG